MSSFFDHKALILNQNMASNSELSGSLVLDNNSLEQDEINQSIHLPDTEGGGIKSRFDAKVVTMSYSSKVEETLEYTKSTGRNTQTEEDLTTVNYSLKYRYDILTDLNIRSELPRMEIKDELKDMVEICYIDNMAHHMIKSAQMLVNDEPKQSFDSVSLDIIWKYNPFSDDEKKIIYEQRIGNVTELTNWTTILPRWVVKPKVPFFFSRHRSQGLPIFKTLSKNGDKCNISFKFVYKLDLSNFIRMRVRNSPNDDWEIVKFDKNVLRGDPDMILDVPSIKGCYSIISDEERLHLSSFSRKYYTYDFINVRDNDNPVNEDTTKSVDLITDDPVLSIFFMASRVEAYEMGYTSNYTTDPNDAKIGWHPIKSFQLFYGQTERTELLSFDECEDVAMQSFKSVPPINSGYGVYTYANNPFEFTRTAEGRVMEPALKCQLKITIKDENPFKYYSFDDNDNDIIKKLTRPKPSEDNKDKYRLQVRLMVQKVLVF